MSCLPVLVLGTGAALAHLLRSDAQSMEQPGHARSPGQDQATDRAFGSNTRRDLSTQAIRPDRLADAQALADRLTATGKRVSRRSLGGAGLHGSNAELVRQPPIAS
ncbi:MAG: hypothetical protein ACRDPY_02845 [Streptosporangiaceae bacterium]